MGLVVIPFVLCSGFRALSWMDIGADVEVDAVEVGKGRGWLVEKGVMVCIGFILFPDCRVQTRS